MPDSGPGGYLSRAPPPSPLRACCLLAIQILGGVEEQQGADGADVAGQTPEPLLSFVLRLRLGVHTHGKVLQLLLGQDWSGWRFSTMLIDPAPS